MTGMEPGSSAIEVSGLVKKYPGSESPALDGISFTVTRGEIFGLLGPNGAGKTTLVSVLSTLAGFDSGSVRVLGLDARSRKSGIRRATGVVPQDIALYPALTALENLRFFGSLYGLSGSDLDSRSRSALRLVGLEAKADIRACTFSGGMQRRLNLAAGIVHSPSVLLLDEPTVGVDPQSRRFIFENVRKMAAEGATVLYTTHYMEEAEELCSRVAILDMGRIIALAAPAALVESHGADRALFKLPARPEEALLAGLRSVAGVEGAECPDRVLEISLKSARKSLPEVIAFLDSRGAIAESMEIKPASLEGVFIKLTGRQLRD